jgi:hypothetical protein
LRFWGESGVHEIKLALDDKSDNPNVFVRASSDELRHYRPPEICVRRGWFRDERTRRVYDYEKCLMFDYAVEQSWLGMHGHLSRWVTPAIAANVRDRLLRLILD